MVNRRLALIVLGFLVPIAGCGKSNRCASHADCLNSQAADDVGRCFPKEVYCNAGACRATCSQICTTANSVVNACSDSNLVCNDATTPREVAFCTALPIACTSVDDCPLYRPADAQGVQHDWMCQEGTCRYPGLEYAAEADAGPANSN